MTRTAGTRAAGSGAARPVTIGVLGAHSFVANQAVIPAIEAARGCRLGAIGSRGGVLDYAAVLDDPAIDAVYLPLPNDLHLVWAERAAAAGKHVLCEKPLGSDAADAERIVTACAEAGLVLAEAWMTPFDPRFATMLELARSGAIGAVTRVDARFTFTYTMEDATSVRNGLNYRWDPDRGGGALLDVGIYCLGAPVALWGAEPDEVTATCDLGATGTDVTTAAELVWRSGVSASIRCSFAEPECQRLELIGTEGRLVADGDAFSGGPKATTFVAFSAEGRHEHRVEPDDCYRRMVEAFGDAVRGDAAWPRPPEDSLATMRLLDRIASAGRG